MQFAFDYWSFPALPFWWWNCDCTLKGWFSFSFPIWIDSFIFDHSMLIHYDAPFFSYSALARNFLNSGEWCVFGGLKNLPISSSNFRCSVLVNTVRHFEDGGCMLCSAWLCPPLRYNVIRLNIWVAENLNEYCTSSTCFLISWECCISVWLNDKIKMECAIIYWIVHNLSTIDTEDFN